MASASYGRASADQRCVGLTRGDPPRRRGDGRGGSRQPETLSRTRHFHPEKPLLSTSLWRCQASRRHSDRLPARRRSAIRASSTCAIAPEDDVGRPLGPGSSGRSPADRQGFGDRQGSLPGPIAPGDLGVMDRHGSSPAGTSRDAQPDQGLRTDLGLFESAPGDRAVRFTGPVAPCDLRVQLFRPLAPRGICRSLPTCLSLFDPPPTVRHGWDGSITTAPSCRLIPLSVASKCSRTAAGRRRRPGTIVRQTPLSGTTWSRALRFEARGARQCRRVRPPTWWPTDCIG